MVRQLSESFATLQKGDTENGTCHFYSAILFIYMISILSTLFVKEIFLKERKIPENHQTTGILSSVIELFFHHIVPNSCFLFSFPFWIPVSLMLPSLSFACFCDKYREMTLTRLEGYPYKSCGSVSLPELHKTYLGQTFSLFQLQVP